MDERSLGSRIIVVGVSGCGKTTLARQLAAVLASEHVKLDSLAHDDQWRRLRDDEFLARAEPKLEKARWVAEGALSVVPPGAWEKAETIIWLDYPRSVVLGRLFRRAAATGLWLRTYSSKSDFLARVAARYYRPWADMRHGWRTYATGRAEYERELRTRVARGHHFLRISHPRECAELIKTLQKKASTPTLP